MAVRHHIKVIVIDKDQAFCDTMGVLLEDNGYRPRTFADPEPAIQAANEESCQIALVDLDTAGVQSADVVAKLKLIDERMCVIVLAGSADFEAARSVMRQGAGDYLIKPLKSEVLIEAVDRACQRLGLIYTSESELNKLIGQRIRAERLRQNLTLRQLSDRTDLTTSQLSQVELGKNAASIWALARISNALGLRVSVLLSGL